MTELNEHSFLGFYKELEKTAVSTDTGLKGLALGAALGAGLTYMTADQLDDVVRENKTMAVITGALIGAGLMGGIGYFFGKKKPKQVINPQTGRPIPVTRPTSRMDTNAPPEWY